MQGVRTHPLDQLTMVIAIYVLIELAKSTALLVLKFVNVLIASNATPPKKILYLPL